MNSLKRTFAALCLIAGCTVVSQGVYAQSEEPIIEFHTNIYAEKGAQNAFSMRLGTTEKTYVDVDCGFGTFETEVDFATFDGEAGSIKATVIPCTVSEEGIVRVYGDASKIDYIDLEGCYVDWINFEKCTNVTIIDFQHNELKALDLTPFTKMLAIYLTDNPFTAETPLKIGPNKPDLMFLEVDIVDYFDPSFNLSDYPSLVSFDGYHNRGLKYADPTGCPELQILSLEMTDVSTLDISKNPKLLRLNISESRIKSIDTSQNPLLQNFLAQHVSGTINTDVKIDKIDVTNNPSLMLLNAGGNNLTEIDLSNNPFLTNLTLLDNKLTELDLSANSNLYSVDISYNYLNFATLPLPQDTWGEYYYFRSPLPCEKSYAKGAEIDFSKEVLRQGSTTTVRVWSVPVNKDAQLVDPSGYDFADGKISFNTVYADSVYVEFINSAFAEYSISSAPFMVKNADEIGKPSKMVAMKFTSAMAGKEIAFKVGMDNATVEAPKTFYVDLGDGTLIPYNATSIEVPANANCTPTVNGELTLYIPENESLTALEVNGVAMTSIDLSAATELRWLTLTGCDLSTIGLGTNRCLQTLDLSGNRIGNLDLAGVRGNYEKNVLREVKASNNRIYSFTIVANRQIEKLDLSDNKLTSFGLKDYISLVDLDLSNNTLKEDLNLAYLEQAKRIDLSGNSLTSLVLVDMPSLETLDISHNNFTLETIPYIENASSEVYVYAPQRDIQLAEFAPGVNLTAQNRVIDGKGTTFTWKKADGTPLVEGVDMTCKDGATRFLNTDLGKVYCEMTNPAFPSFTGANVFKTTEVTVTGAPTTVVASFTTAASGTNGEVIFTGTKVSALYIDWRGDGTEYIQYPITGETYTAYNEQTYYEGAEAKVYTYEAVEDIVQFSIYGVPMTKMDASPMTNLHAFALGGAGVDESTLKLPESASLVELTLNDNALSTNEILKRYPLLKYLNLSGNNYTAFDASGIPELETIMLGRNKLTDIKLDNNLLWGLDITSNQLSEISFERTPSLSQILMADNKFSTIDLMSLKNVLVALDLQRNNFDFATLPLATDFPLMTLYRFAGQAPLAVECVNGKVDLSAQAEVAGTPTTFRWFLGEITEDPDTGELVGEELETGGDDPEYTIENGVTTFHYSYNKEVTCIMTNPVYENLILSTLPLKVDKAGIGNVLADVDDGCAPVDVYSISGVKVRSQVVRSEALKGLAPGFYIVGGEKVLVK